MSAGHTALVAAALVLAAATSACGHSTSDAATRDPDATKATTRGNAEPLGPCQQLPAPAASNPPWLPADLTLPSGAYPVREGPPESGVSTYVFVVPLAPDDFSDYALRTWKAAGWKLNRPESEGFEGENRFTKGSAYGGFKVRAVYCDKTRAELTLAVGQS